MPDSVREVPAAWFFIGQKEGARELDIPLDAQGLRMYRVEDTCKNQ
jgi:hypothetical protein